MADLYPNNFLDKVIIRIDFANPIESLRNDLDPNLKLEILKQFPISEPPKRMIQKEVTFNITKEKSNIEDINRGELFDWIFHGKNREKSLHLNIDNMYIQYSKYTCFDHLKRDFFSIVKPLISLTDTFGVKRLGLRYIDKIALNESKPLNWTKYLNKNLLCILKVPDKNQSLLRAFNILEVQSEDINVRFQYGMFNPDFPAPIHRKEFILDYDAYHEGLLQSLREIDEKLVYSRQLIKEFFENSIEDGLRRMMRE